MQGDEDFRNSLESEFLAFTLSVALAKPLASLTLRFFIFTNGSNTVC